MQAKKDENKIELRQVEGSGVISGGVSRSLCELAIKWANDNPAVELRLDEVDHIIAAMSPFLEVLASDAFMNEAKQRYQEEGVKLEFDVAVYLAILYMTWRVPYTGEVRPLGSDPQYIRDYEILASEARRKRRLHELIEKSVSNPLAYSALQEVVSEVRQRDGSFPEELYEWILDVAEGKREMPKLGRGRNPYANQIRNELIVRTIRALIDCGFTATRNDASEPLSACDVVSRALKAHEIELTYDSVAKVWANNKVIPLNDNTKEE